MRLRELEATFTKRDLETIGQVRWTDVSFSEAGGVQFLCPKCFLKNSGNVGTHWILCWRPMVGQDWVPTPGRWEFQGTGLEDLTLVAGSSSILLKCTCKQPCTCCKAHFFIKNGEIVGLT